MLQQNTHSDEEKQSTVPVQTNQQQVYDILADARAQPVTAAGPTAAAAGAALSTQQLNISLLPPPCERPGPTDHQLLAEQAQAATLVANTPPFTLEVCVGPMHGVTGMFCSCSALQPGVMIQHRFELLPVSSSCV